MSDARNLDAIIPPGMIKVTFGSRRTEYTVVHRAEFNHRTLPFSIEDWNRLITETVLDFQKAGFPVPSMTIDAEVEEDYGDVRPKVTLVFEARRKATKDEIAAYEAREQRRHDAIRAREIADLERRLKSLKKER